MEGTTEVAESLDVVDVEDFARNNPPDHRKPKVRFYVIRIDRETYKVETDSMTGREILRLAGKTPESHKLYQKLKGGEVNPIEPDQRVDFTAPGVERFQTIPLDPTEG